MKSSSATRFKTNVAIFLMVIFGPLGNVMLGKGMKEIGAVSTASPRELAHVLLRVLQTPAIWLGIASLLAFFVTYMFVLSWADYSYVQPASSIAYVVVALLGHFVLRETVTPIGWMGVSVICLGVFVVGRTSPGTTEQKP
jgi:drug/metabolite transporter (DMT)-like permease